ncbi:MAG: beta-propeller fold lactonase family protein [bacterium]
MKPAKPKRLLSFSAISVVVLAVIAFVGHRWADNHVRYITGGQPGPVSCLPCHAHLNKNALIERFMEKSYLSPLDIAVSPDGRRLYVTAEDADALLVVSPTEGRLLAKIAVGKRPHSVVLSEDGKTGYVSNRWSDNISVIDLAQERVTGTLQVGSGPAGLALDREGKTLFVANSYSNDISAVNLTTSAEIKRLSAGRDPYAVALSPDGKSVYVTNRLSNPVPARMPPVSEVTVVDTKTQRVVERTLFLSAQQLEGIHFTPSGDLALATLVKPKNLLPLTQVGRGWMMTFGLGIIERGKDGRTAQILLDDVNAFYADPHDIVVTPDGQRAFVSHSGANCVTGINLEALRSVLANATEDSLTTFANHLGLSSRYVIKRIPTGANPKGLALSPDGQHLYVTERLQDRIAIINAETMELVENIELGKPQSVSSVRRGQQLFNNANAGAFQGQFSCRTCHPDGDHDALTYDIAPDGLGLNLVNTLSLRDIGETAPYKWNGKNVSIYMQCGIRFAKFLTRAEPFSPEKLNSLVAYILSLSHPPNRYRSAAGKLNPTQQRGKAIYERTLTNDGRTIPLENQCMTCHPPPYFTNRQKADVGTLAKTDSPKEFDVTHLVNLYATAPYLHDGRAATLEEIWTKFNPDDKHGVANDLTKAQLNDLVEYLKVLGSDKDK